jgi:hypothetical protein
MKRRGGGEQPDQDAGVEGEVQGAGMHGQHTPAAMGRRKQRIGGQATCSHDVTSNPRG